MTGYVLRGKFKVEVRMLSFNKCGVVYTIKQLYDVTPNAINKTLSGINLIFGGKKKPLHICMQQMATYAIISDDVAHSCNNFLK